MMKRYAYFAQRHQKSELKDKSLRGGVATLSSQGVILCTRILSTAVLARLLSPADFGLFAMVVTLTSFADLFKDAGLSVATIQEPQITHNQISNLFWINVAVGGITMFFVAGMAPVLVWFYHDARLLNVTMLLSIVFFMGGLTMQHRALLNRQMLFSHVAIAEAGSVVLSVIVALGYAWFRNGCADSYMALVWMMISRSLFLMIGVWLLCGWVPGWIRRGVGTVSLLRFGVGVAGFNIVNYFSRNADNILIGRYCGTGPLAFYSKAYQFLLLPIQQFRMPLVSVATPALSSLRSDPSEYRRYMEKLVAILAFVTMPLMVYSAVSSDIIVRVFFGPKWSASIPIFCILSLLGFVQPIAGMNGLVLITTGMSRRYFLFGIYNGVILVISFAVGLWWGATGVAVLYTIVSYIILLPSWWFCFRGTPVDTGLFIRSTAYPAFASLVTGLLLLLFRDISILPHDNAFFMLFITVVYSALVYLILYIISCRGRKNIVEYLSYLLALFPKRKNFIK